ncbi:glycoside hydrolase [Podospora fimiseda]|uniref:Glycoside hydrolase n=1 Tax=Podospora fimiseda TaxID=252190 RepID=A0AAN7BWH3_9PEZI|nr:glycoside hydrolase [Podospora fimiseda]
MISQTPKTTLNDVLIPLLSFTLLFSQQVHAYTLIDTFNSSNFFSEFDFFSQPDPTNGFVDYVNISTANHNKLAGYSQGGIYLGVDHHNLTNGTTTGGRKSTRLTSKTAYTTGLFIADIAHMPSGKTRAEDSCGLWPAYWMFGPNWPNSGEIDIIEGVNTQKANSITLHTANGCSMSNNTGSISTTKMVSSDCEGNGGCGQQTQALETYGIGFNSGGGGYYIMEWTESFISVWFVPRSNAETVTKLLNTIDTSNSSSISITSSLGGQQPLATFNGGNDCSISNHFANHNIVFDTTFCGDWAGKTWKSDSTCSALADTCEEWVGQNPEKFVSAYWLINEIKVYQKKGGSNNKTKREAVRFRG